MNKWQRRILLLIVLISLYGLNTVTLKKIHNLRDKHELSTMPTLKGVPPEIAFTTMALGAFRGILVDFLWLRVMDLQEKGEYFEIVQISEWITLLEPRLDSVWTFHSWNMAYNISMEMLTPQKAWNWIDAGIRILRDKGLYYNPKSKKIFLELAWLYFFKVGGNTDDFNIYFKIQLAQTMDDLLGEKTPAQIIEEASSTDAQVRDNALSIIKELEDKEQLSIERMAKVDKDYQPLDWRSPFSIALYWLEIAQDNFAPKTPYSVKRLIYIMLQSVFRSGGVKLIKNDEGRIKALINVPNFDYLTLMQNHFEKMIQEESEPQKSTLKKIYKNFLEEVITLFYSYNHQNKIAGVFAKLKERYATDPKYQLPAKIALFQLFEEKIQSMNNMELANYLLGLYTNSYVHLAIGNEDYAIGTAELATKLLTRFKKKYPHKVAQIPSINYIKEQAIQNANVQLRPLGPKFQEKLKELIKK